MFLSLPGPLGIRFDFQRRPQKVVSFSFFGRTNYVCIGYWGPWSTFNWDNSEFTGERRPDGHPIGLHNWVSFSQSAVWSYASWFVGIHFSFGDSNCEKWRRIHQICLKKLSIIIVACSSWRIGSSFSVRSIAVRVKIRSSCVLLWKFRKVNKCMLVSFARQPASFVLKLVCVFRGERVWWRF